MNLQHLHTFTCRDFFICVDDVSHPSRRRVVTFFRNLEILEFLLYCRKFRSHFVTSQKIKCRLNSSLNKILNGVKMRIGFHVEIVMVRSHSSTESIIVEYVDKSFAMIVLPVRLRLVRLSIQKIALYLLSSH